MIRMCRKELFCSANCDHGRAINRLTAEFITARTRETIQIIQLPIGRAKDGRPRRQVFFKNDMFYARNALDVLQGLAGNVSHAVLSFILSLPEYRSRRDSQVQKPDRKLL